MLLRNADYRVHTNTLTPFHCRSRRAHMAATGPSLQGATPGALPALPGSRLFGAVHTASGTLEDVLSLPSRFVTAAALPAALPAALTPAQGPVIKIIVMMTLEFGEGEGGNNTGFQSKEQKKQIGLITRTPPQNSSLHRRPIPSLYCYLFSSDLNI